MQESTREPGPDTLNGRHVRVLVHLDLPDEYLREIESTDPRVLVISTKGSNQDQSTALAGAEVLLAFQFPPDWLEAAASLRWIQLASAGSENVQQMVIAARRPDLMLTTASGIHEIPISEHIVGMILHFARGFHRAVRSQAQGRWERFTAGEAYGRRVCLVGYGPIARRTAQLCKALGMEVVVVRASIGEQQPGSNDVDRFYPPADLNAVLSDSDYVVVAAPRTVRTEKIIGREQLASMKPEAVLINISRGALIDEDALIEALHEGRLAGAGLDVFEQEPLPAGSPLWAMPNVLITPHNAGSNPHYNRRVVDLFIDNLSRYLRGEPLRNRVDIERGY